MMGRIGARASRSTCRRATKTRILRLRTRESTWRYPFGDMIQLGSGRLILPLYWYMGGRHPGPARHQGGAGTWYGSRQAQASHRRPSLRGGDGGLFHVLFRRSRRNLAAEYRLGHGLAAAGRERRRRVWCDLGTGPGRARPGPGCHVHAHECRPHLPDHLRRRRGSLAAGQSDRARVGRRTLLGQAGEDNRGRA